MGFRDDELAGRERVEMLERELESLREDNEKLRESSTQKSGVSRSKLGPLALLVFSLSVVFAALAFMSGWRIPTHGDDLGIALALVASFLVVLAVGLGIVSRLLIIVPPGTMLVLSGRQTRLPDGSTRGYRMVTGGRVFRVPILERTDVLDVTPMRIDGWVRGAYTRGNVPADIHFRAMVEIDTRGRTTHNAVERFLGRDRREVEQVARETLEGALRAIAAQLTTEELLEDRARVAEELHREVFDDYGRLGLSAETLHLLEVEPR